MLRVQNMTVGKRKAQMKDSDPLKLWGFVFEKKAY
jgi:hypothetical protein